MVHLGVRAASPLLRYRAPRAAGYVDAANSFREAGAERVLLVTGKNVFARGLCESLLAAFGKAGVEAVVFSNVPADPTLSCVEEAFALYKEKGCGGVAAVGGGSPIDCAKGVCARAASPKRSLKKMKGALRVKGKPPLLLAVPTTAGSGSEVTAAAVFTDETAHEKFAVFSYKIVPKMRVLDASLTRTLPPSVTAETGLDALTHAVEAYLGRATTKRSREKAESAVRAVFENLPLAYAEGENTTARANMLAAASDAGIAFTISYVGYVHALAHALGGAYGLPHGRLCAMLLPHVLRAYGKKAEKKLARLSCAAGSCEKSAPREEAAELFLNRTEQLIYSLGIPGKIPIEDDAIPLLARRAAKEANPLYPVPRLLDAKELEEILHAVRAENKAENK